jgi:hypothetical protein
VPFHVEISSPINFARALNIDERDLRKAVLEPWVTGLPLVLGDRDWEPRDSRLTILEGPAVPPPTAGDDGGWATALRTAEDVTRPMIEVAEAGAPAQTAMVIEADSVEAGLQDLYAGQRPRQIPWVDAVERIEGRDAGVAAVILVLKHSRSARPRL